MYDELLVLLRELDPARASRWRRLHTRVRPSRKLRPALAAAVGGVVLLATVVLLWNRFGGTGSGMNDNAGTAVRTGKKPVAPALTRLLGVSRSVSNANVTNAWPRTPAAYRSYLTGLGLEGVGERSDDAIGAYRLAIAEDSTFALAHTRLTFAKVEELGEVE